jgi:N-acetylglucosamine kinase
MSGEYFVGVDGGGTKTQAALIDALGDEIARASGGPSNYHAVGVETAEASLRAAIYGVLDAARLEATDVAALGLGIAGAARPRDKETVRAVLARIARFPCVLITHDAETALMGAIGRRYGVVLIAGTGAIAYGVNARGETCRADGWGHLLGDEGSAYWIGREALRAAARAHDRRGPDTDLAERLLSHLDLSDASKLIRHVYADGFGVPQVAALAPLVEGAALDGDPIAQAILRQAGWHLGSTLRAVILGLQMREQAFDVALMGGVLRAQGVVRETVVGTLGEVAPRARAIEPRHDAAWGAALLARQAAE